MRLLLLLLLSNRDKKHMGVWHMSTEWELYPVGTMGGVGLAFLRRCLAASTWLPAFNNFFSSANSSSSSSASTWAGVNGVWTGCEDGVARVWGSFWEGVARVWRGCG